MTAPSAAQALGVDEDTLRRSEQRGLIRSVRLPSGVRRFRSKDVADLRRQRFSGFPDAVEAELPRLSGLRPIEG